MSAMAVYTKLKALINDKEIRENRKISYRTIAQETGIPLSVLTNYASQKVRRYDSQTLDKLCTYFGCELGDLLVHTKTPNEQKFKAAPKKPKKK